MFPRKAHLLVRAWGPQGDGWRQVVVDLVRDGKTISIQTYTFTLDDLSGGNGSTYFTLCQHCEQPESQHAKDKCLFQATALLPVKIRIYGAAQVASWKTRVPR